MSPPASARGWRFALLALRSRELGWLRGLSTRPEERTTVLNVPEMRSRFPGASCTIPTSKKRMAAAKTKVFLDGCWRFYVDGPCWTLARKADVSFVGFQEAAAKPDVGRRPFRPNLEAAMQNLTLSLFWILTTTPLRATSAGYCQKCSRWVPHANADALPNSLGLISAT